jgi:DNA repair protein RadC
VIEAFRSSARDGDGPEEPEQRNQAGRESEAPATASSADGPRERLGGLGAAALSDSELISLLLRTGGGGRDVLDVARALLSSFGGLCGLAREDTSLLQEVAGVGPVKSASLVAACELGRRLATRRLEIGCRIQAPSDVHRHFFERLRDYPQERFHAILLDGRHRVIREVLVSQGTLTASLVHPREVFRQAVRQSAAALVLVHNHPSGDPTPSSEDRRVTERLLRAGEVLGIRVLDHVVVAEHGYHSFNEAGEL